jgi:hypothetical protein
LSNTESLFDISQQLAEAFNPIFKVIQPEKKKHGVRPTTMATKKRVTFQLEGEGDEEIKPKSISSESMSESLSSDGSPAKFTSIQYPSKSDMERHNLRNIKNYRKVSQFYKPALMTKNFTREMPLFLSEKNMDALSHLFNNLKFQNKYQKNIKEMKKFKRLKFINQQKTKTQDRLGELTEKEDIKSFLEKEPREIFANALRNFWFKDADSFIKAKKSLYVQKESLWDMNEPDVYERMEKDVVRRSKKNLKQKH